MTSKAVSKADTSLKRTPRGVGRTSVIYFISLQGGHLQGGQSELVPSVSDLEGVDCIIRNIITQQ